MTGFSPKVRYYTALDMVMLLTEDVSYRAKTHNRFVEWLFHPTEERLVGLKVNRAKKVHALFEEPVDQPIRFFLFVMAAVIEEMAPEPFLTRETLDFLKRTHKFDVTPEERQRINFSLVP